MQVMDNVKINGIELEESEVWIREGSEHRNHQQPTVIKVKASGTEKAQLKALDEGRADLVCQGNVGGRRLILEDGIFTESGRGTFVAKFLIAAEA